MEWGASNDSDPTIESCMKEDGSMPGSGGAAGVSMYGQVGQPGP